MPNPTIVAASLDDKELRESINKLVAHVGSQTQEMKRGFDKTIQEMVQSLQSLGKVKIDLSNTFTGLEKAKEVLGKGKGSATGGSGGGGATGKTEYEEGTIGALKEEIRLQGQVVDLQIRGTEQARQEVDAHRELQRQLKEETKSTTQRQQESAKRTLKNVLSLPQNDLKEAEYRLKALLNTASAYKTKNSGILSEEQWHRLNNAIAKTRQQIDKLQEKKPKSLKDVLGMDESSVDAIARKMRALKSVQINPKNAQDVKALSDAYQTLAKKQNEYLGKNRLIQESNKQLTSILNYVRNRIIYAFTVGSMMSFVRDIFRVRAEYEMLDRSLGILIGSFEKGTQVFNQLNKMALESPFTLMELAGAAKQLTAYNFAENEVVETTRRLADISAALGVPMERLTYNLGQIRAQTVLNARDARDFANAGLPIVKSLSDYYTELEGKIVSTGEVYDRMSKKMVSYNDVMAVLNKMTDEGGKFFDFQARQAETLKVQLANLTLAYNNMLNGIGKSHQGSLTFFVQSAKVLFQNWATLNRVIVNVGLSLGFLKVAQMMAIRYNWQLAASAGGAAKMMTVLENAFKKMGTAIKSIATNPWSWIFVGIFAVTDFIGKMRAAKQVTEELNEELRAGAKEASESNINYLNNKGNKATRQLAQENKLTAEEGGKAWESIAEQISTSAMSANKLLGELWDIDDINKRVKDGFDYTERIQKAQAALQDLKDDTIKITSDIGWGGIFGEGLVSDLEDYYEKLEEGIKDMRQRLTLTGGKNADVYSDWLASIGISKGAGGDARYQFEEELKETAESINNFIVAHNIKDPLQMGEILERVKAIIKTKNPEIKGDLATLFDVSLDNKMFELTNGAIDKNTSLWEIFLERLKHNYSSTFQGITDDIYKDNAKLSKEQQKAIDDNLEYFKNTMPWYYNAIADMVKDASQLRINIGVAFNVQRLTDFQKEVNDRISSKYGTVGAGQFNAMLPSQNDDLPSWVKTQQEAIAKLKEDNKKYAKDHTEWAKKHVADNNAEIESRKKLLDMFNQSYEKEKKNNKGGNKKDPMLNTLKQTIDVVKKLQSEYDTLTKAGMSSGNALAKVQGNYKRTLALLNNDLAKYGLPQVGTNLIKGSDPNVSLEYFKKISNIISNKGLSTLERQKALEVVIQELSVKAETYNLDKITKGLNNELGKLKEEYELAVELDANPELGNMFAELWGIDMDALPHTAQEYAKGVTESLNKYLKDAKTGMEIEDVLGLTDDDLGFLDDLLESESITQTTYDLIQKVVKAARDARNKEIKETISGYEKLLEKYSEYEYKMLQIERKANNERKTFAMKFGNDSQKSEVIGLITDIDIEKDPQKKGQLKEQLKKVLTEIAGSDAAKLQLTVAIDNRELQEGAKLAFEEFKKTPDWIIATGDLAGLTDKALRGLIKRIDDYKKKAKNLDPKQIKEINRALKALHKQVRQGNPFSAIIDVIEQAKERTEVYQPELDSIMSDIVSLEKEIGDNDPTPEQAKHLKTLKDKWEEVKEAQTEAGKVDAMQITGAINDTIQAASQATKVFTDMMDAIAGSGNGASQTLKDITSVLEKGGQGAAIGAQIGGGYGAIIGAAAGVVTGLVSIFAGAGNRRITEAVEESERAVKRLENRVESLKGSYDAMTDSAEHSYGAQSEAAKLAASSIKEQEIAMKRLMLAETKRQLRLEQSRDSKDRDDDKILSLQKEYISQQNEIDSMLRETNRAVDEVVDSLLGISRGSWAEELTDALISAFKAGEDYMNVFEDSWEEMVQNLVVKTIAAEVIGDALQTQVLDKIEAIEKEKTDPWTEHIQYIADRKAFMQQKYLDNQSEWLDNLQNSVEGDAFVKEKISQFDDVEKQAYDKMVDVYGKEFAKRRVLAAYAQEFQDKLMALYDSWIAESKKSLDQSQQTAQIRALEEVLTGPAGTANKDALMNSIKDVFPKIMETWGIQFGQDAEKELSALQRGIQGITEQTAGAIEGYMNGVSQQVYLQSNILQQINIAVQSFNFDAQLGTISQILLQLQTTYQNQQAIRSIMEGWTNASGMAVRVEMV